MKALVLAFSLAFGVWKLSLIPAGAQSYEFTTIAGVVGGSGSANGTNSNARYYNPTGVAIDAAGNLYIADQLNHMIRRLSPAGTNWVSSTVAGMALNPGSDDGTNTDARFNKPSGITADDSGNLFVADTFNHTIRKIVPSGTNWIVSTIAGVALTHGYDDGTNSDARFYDPQALAVEGGTNLYVADRLNFIIRKMAQEGTNWVTTTIAGLASIFGGFVDGLNGDAEFNLPYGLVLNPEDDLFVTDFGNNAIRRITPQGPDWLTTTLTGFSGLVATNDGPASVAGFNSPNGITMDPQGNLFVTDQFNNTIRRIAPLGNDWTVNTIGGLAGQRGATNGIGSVARFNRPWGIAIDGFGNLFVADAFNNTIRKGTPQTTSPPPLGIVLSASQVVLTWPASASSYSLETASGIGAGAAWAVVTNGIFVGATAYSYTNTANSTAAYFRLNSR